MTARNVLVFRIVAVAWLVGWFWKAPTYAGYYLSEIWTYRIHYAGLPGVLVHPAVVTVAWLAPFAALGAVLVPRPRVVRAAAIGMTICAFVGCIHFETCNDATFVTSFWAGLWLVWFTANGGRDDAAFTRHASRLARSIVALMFLGGALGKLTGAYVHGDAFYHLYFIQKDSWPYTALRAALSPTALHGLAVWFSRAALAVELGLVALPIAPWRIATRVAIAAIALFVLVSTLYLVSVMACLIGLLLAVLQLERSTPA